MPARHRKNQWPVDMTAHSDALDLEPKVFEKESAGAIAASLKEVEDCKHSVANPPEERGRPHANPKPQKKPTKK